MSPLLWCRAEAQWVWAIVASSPTDYVELNELFAPSALGLPEQADRIDASASAAFPPLLCTLFPARTIFRDELIDNFTAGKTAPGQTVFLDGFDTPIS
jgi:hypothetical protein